MILAWQLVIGWIALLGLVGFIVMGVDKSRARHGEWRVPERTFYALALIGGVFGILIASSVFHHKTTKSPFIEVVLLLSVAWIVILVELERALGTPFG